MLLIIALNGCSQKSKLLGYWNDGSLEELRYTEDSVFHYIDGEPVQGAPYKIMGNIVQHKFLICELLGTGICAAHMIVNDKLLIRDQEGNLEVVYKNGKIKNYQGNLLSSKKVKIQLPIVKGEVFENTIDSLNKPVFNVVPIYGGSASHDGHQHDSDLFHIQLNDVLAEVEGISEYLEYSDIQNKKRIIPLFIDKETPAKSFIPVLNELKKAQCYSLILITENEAVKNYNPNYGVTYKTQPISDYEIELFNKVYSENPFTERPTANDFEEKLELLKSNNFDMLHIQKDNKLNLNYQKFEFDLFDIALMPFRGPIVLVIHEQSTYEQYVRVLAELQKLGENTQVQLLEKEYRYLRKNELLELSAL